MLCRTAGEEIGGCNLPDKDIASDLLSTPYHLVYAAFELLYLQRTEVWGGERFHTLPQQKEI